MIGAVIWEVAGRILQFVFFPPFSKVVLAAGKAGAAMGAAMENLAADRIERGLVVTKDGHGAPLSELWLRYAGHPLPDERSEAAAREAIALAEGASPDEVLVVLLSGGGPRGEVGLVFASFAYGHEIFCCETYSSLGMVILLTTLAGPDDVIVDVGAEAGLGDEDLSLVDVVVGQLLAFFHCLDSGFRPDSPSDDGIITRVVSDFEIHRR